MDRETIRRDHVEQVGERFGLKGVPGLPFSSTASFDTAHDAETAAEIAFRAYTSGQHAKVSEIRAALNISVRS